jgi:flagellar biosynthesis protein FlhG
MKKKPLILSITSGKGGVGKTFTTINLATTLSKMKNKVLVVDCDLGLANIDIMLGINPVHTLQDVLFGHQKVRDVLVHTAGGFDLIPSSSGVRDMAQLLFEKIELVKSMILEFTDYDVVLLDTGAGISEVVLQFNLLASRNLIIINRELTCLTDAYSMIKVMFQVFGRSNYGIVVNSVTDEKEALAIFAHINAISLRFLGFDLQYVGYILRDNLAAQSILTQKIAVLLSPDSKIADNFEKISKNIAF